MTIVRELDLDAEAHGDAAGGLTFVVRSVTDDAYHAEPLGEWCDDCGLPWPCPKSGVGECGEEK
jgi:hypothetical protein